MANISTKIESHIKLIFQRTYLCIWLVVFRLLIFLFICFQNCASQTAPQQPAVCGLVEDVLRKMLSKTTRVVVKKTGFFQAIEKVIHESKSLSKKYNDQAIKACLSGGIQVLDDALYYLSKTGKVSSSTLPIFFFSKNILI